MDAIDTIENTQENKLFLAKMINLLPRIELAVEYKVLELTNYLNCARCAVFTSNTLCSARISSSVFFKSFLDQ